MKKRVRYWLIGVMGFSAVLFAIAANSGCLSKDEMIVRVQDHSTTINGLKTYYQTVGDASQQTIVFLHGWGARKNNVCGKGKEHVVAELAQRFHVVALELPGLVRTAPPPNDWSTEDYTAFVHAFLETLRLEKPIIMGQSFGGGIASTYAEQYPEQTSGVILVDASQSNRPNNWYYRLRFKWKPLFDGVVGAKYVPLFVKKSMLTLWLGTPWSHVRSHDAASRYLVMSDIETQYSVKTDYKALRMPVLMVWGSKDTRVTPLERAKEIHAEIPQSMLVIVDGGGHLALYTHTKQVVDAIGVWAAALR